MEKRLKGHSGWYLRYDIDTAKKVGEHEGITLYRKVTGEYFLAQDGEVAALDYDTAKSWTKKNLPEETYQRYFGAIKKTAKRKTVCLSLPESTIQKIKRECEKTHKTQSDVVMALVERHL